MVRAVVALAGLAAASAWSCGRGIATVLVDTATGGYSVSIAGQPWLQDGQVTVRASGTTLSSADKTLEPSSSEQTEGSTSFGKYAGLKIGWNARATHLAVFTSFRCFESGLIQFVLSVPAGADDVNTTFIAPNGPANGAAPPVTQFPSFSGAPGTPLGSELRTLSHAGPWTLFEDWTTGLQGAVSARGPVYLMNQTFRGAKGAAAEAPATPTVTILSPGDAFLSQHWFVDRRAHRLSIGSLSTALSLPPGHNTSTVLFASPDGVTATAQAWGQQMRAAYGTQRLPRSRDPVRDKLSAWTDNGAVYFQSYWDAHCPTRNCTANGTSAAVTLGAWADSFKAQGLPVGICQLDTWWFLQGADVGNKQGGIDCADWWPREDLFPDGLAPLEDKVPLLLYAWGFIKPEDGQRMLNYTWETQLLQGSAVSQDKAMVALDEVLAFYTEIRDRFVLLGGTSFEQDNMGQMTQSYTHSINSTTGAERWFTGFATPFCEASIPVQICEASPAELLESLKYDCITNSRDNIDDVPGQHSGYFVERWHVGFDRMLMGALDIAPFFDNVWTMPTQPSSTWGNASEDYLELAWILSVLGGGPVGFGDEIHNTNVTLVRTAHREDGVLLHPSFPSNYLDANYLDAAHGPFDATVSRVFQAPSVVGTSAAGPAHFSILAVDMNTSWSLDVSQLVPSPPSSTSFLSVPWTPGFAAIDEACANGSATSTCATVVSALEPLPLETGAASVPWQHDFELHSLAPCNCGVSGGFALIGELAKVVRVSPLRFSNLKVSCDPGNEALSVDVLGSVGERVDVTIADLSASQIRRLAVMIGGGGSTTVACAVAHSCTVA